MSPLEGPGRGWLTCARRPRLRRLQVRRPLGAGRRRSCARRAGAGREARRGGGGCGHRRAGPHHVGTGLDPAVLGVEAVAVGGRHRPHRLHRLLRRLGRRRCGGRLRRCRAGGGLLRGRWAQGHEHRRDRRSDEQQPEDDRPSRRCSSPSARDRPSRPGAHGRVPRLDVPLVVCVAVHGHRPRAHRSGPTVRGSGLSAVRRTGTGRGCAVTAPVTGSSGCSDRPAGDPAVARGSRCSRCSPTPGRQSPSPRPPPDVRHRTAQASSTAPSPPRSLL